jgi:hypothetical protein
MINEIVNHIKSRLGTTHRHLELSDQDIVRLLHTETLMTLSVYNPFFVEYMLNTDQDRVEGSENTFNVPNELQGFRIIGVEKVLPVAGIPPEYGIAGASFGVLGTDLSVGITAFLNSKLAAGIASTLLPPETFQFIPPNLLRVYNIFQQGQLYCILRTTHRKDFGTVPFGLLETVKKLALADVANDLLGIRSYFQNVGTVFGELNLNVDQLKEWADRRDDVVDSLRKSMLKNTGVRMVYMA